MKRHTFQVMNVFLISIQSMRAHAWHWRVKHLLFHSLVCSPARTHGSSKFIHLNKNSRPKAVPLANLMRLNEKKRFFFCVSVNIHGKKLQEASAQGQVIN